MYSASRSSSHHRQQRVVQNRPNRSRNPISTTSHGSTAPSFDNQFHKRFFSTAPTSPPTTDTPQEQPSSSTTPPPQESQRTSSASKKLKVPMKRTHDMVEKFGREQWEQVVLTATERMNIYLEKTQKTDRKASGIDNNRVIWGEQKVSPAALHNAFRDLSRLNASQRASMILNIWLSAVDFKVGFKPQSKMVNWWLSGLILLVMTMVSAGGITRLTRSGLSMTHWKLTGEKKPRTDEEWAEEFNLYKQSPEWRLHNQDMVVDDFKFIYNMEYGHRQLGRFIGVAFAVPFALFLATGSISIRSKFGKALAGVLSLGGLQGLIGWWMVKSGLDEEANKEKAKVSPYRLATHLTIAFTLLIGLTTLKMRARYGTIHALLKDEILPKKNLFGFYRPTKLAHALATASFITAFTGAFVAGNDAGLVYNEWPEMGEGYVPSDLKSPYLPWHRNIFEHPSCVQFIHRSMAYTTFALSWVAAARCMFSAACPGAIANAAVGTALLTSMQAGLGIYTLLNHVPTEWAAGHQFGAMLVLMSATRLMYHTNNPINGVPNLWQGMTTLNTLVLNQTLVSAEKEKRLDALKLVLERDLQAASIASSIPSQTHIPTPIAPPAATVQAAAVSVANKVNKSSAGLIVAIGMGLGGVTLLKDQFTFTPHPTLNKKFKD